MKISITDCQEINRIQFSPTNFDVFHSMCYVDGQEYTFARNVQNLSWGSTQIKINDEIVGPGEDPRAFDLLGIPACYSVRFTERDRFIPQLYIKGDSSWESIRMRMGDNIDAGKNWAPFVYENEIYFVHEISPFRVVKLEGDVVYSVFAKDLPAEIQPLDSYPSLRGGCNGLDIGNGLVLGFGHDNYANTRDTIKHRPFGWCANMLDQSVDIISVDHNWDDKFNIIDPTAFILKDGQYYLMTCETELAWHISEQAGRVCLYTINFE
jgi:hypothetical protein